MADRPLETPLARGPHDELSVTGIECFAHHGVFEHEKRDGQVFVRRLKRLVELARPKALRQPGKRQQR